MRDHAENIKSESRRLGFDACGIASTGAPIDPDDHLGAWLRADRHANMDWIERTYPVRQDPSQRLAGVRSAIVVARNYRARAGSQPAGTGRVASYAWGRDYHRVLRKPLISLARSIEGLGEEVQTYISLDTGPVLERAWAQRAGLGSIGKHSLAIRRDIGSWFFIGVVFTTLELRADAPTHDICGTCTRCIDACPTQAIVAPYVVDSNRCISYHTIENREEIPADLHTQHGDWVFGCDVCQEVCPWNRFERETTETAFHPVSGRAFPELEAVTHMTRAQFDETFRGSAIRRAKLGGMRRNAEIALRNTERQKAGLT